MLGSHTQGRLPLTPQALKPIVTQNQEKSSEVTLYLTKTYRSPSGDPRDGVERHMDKLNAVIYPELPYIGNAVIALAQLLSSARHIFKWGWSLQNGCQSRRRRGRTAVRGAENTACLCSVQGTPGVFRTGGILSGFVNLKIEFDEQVRSSGISHCIGIAPGLQSESTATLYRQNKFAK